MSGAGAPDFFYREAQRLGYVARSAFKIQNQFKLITSGSSVLDLGCAPGAWLQVACQSLGPPRNGGSVLGIDIKKVKVPHVHCDSRVQTVCADVMNLPKSKLKSLSPKEKGFSVILSDMCPIVSGITTRDAALSVELGMQAVNLALGEAALGVGEVIHGKDKDSIDDSTSASDCDGVLRKGGHLVLKLLESEDTQEFSRMLKPLFRKSSWLRPKATRSSSREIYLICQSLQLQART
ncbi:uncharacterized protein LOC103498139 isoform X4 [Cucumis melo]|uniref:rRNA methyltransferase 2, mitochondrial n=1 Tax=Cucumis melo TaxID=3656 RepID=A0ABM3L5Z4_CUCME|nr:uncharacterized protein LOC103498139 isoform X4 [Cucumis melo]